MRLTLLGAGAMRSPRYAPAGLLVEHGRRRIMLDGGPGAQPDGPLDAWLVTDARSELIGPLRCLAATRGLEPRVGVFLGSGLRIEPRPVEHTSHPTFAYLVRAGGRRVVWAPEFFRFPRWAAGADLMFADAAGWNRPIHFAGGVGGHVAVLGPRRATTGRRDRRRGQSLSSVIRGDGARPRRRHGWRAPARTSQTPPRRLTSWRAESARGSSPFGGVRADAGQSR